MSKDSRYQEIAGLIILSFSIVLLLSLVSYSIGDYKMVMETAVHNIIGPIGAGLSNLLRTAFGYSSYIIFIIMLMAGWSILRRGSLAHVMERLFSLTYLLITTSALLSLIHNRSIPQFSGGYIGAFFTGLLERFTGSTAHTCS